MSTKPRIVVVDNKDYERAYLVRLAEEAGCEVVGTAASGDEGLALVQELNPDIVLTDFVMKVPGSKIAWEITIPTIIVSTDMDDLVKETLRDIGDHVVPFDKYDRDNIITAIKQRS